MTPPLPSAIEAWLERELGGVRVLGAVGGGCINPSVRLRHEGGEAFLKFGTDVPRGFFEVEADGLRALRDAAGSLRVPAVLGVRGPEPGEPAGAACLLLEWLEPGRPGADYWERLGRGLAELHRAGDGAGGWGWGSDGFIGSLPQQNGSADSWAEFWTRRRLQPQLRRAREAGWRVGRDADWETLWHGLPELLATAESDGPSLLHGDLWSGNVLAAETGSGTVPALVDPAAYRGHREVDLAMAELFGGFGATFLGAYEEAWPLQSGYAPGRRAAYQLFYLLVHVNLFGAGYVSRAERALRDALT